MPKEQSKRLGIRWWPLEKYVWAVVILAPIAIAPAILFYTYINSPTDNTFVPNPLSIGDLYVRIGCVSNNTRFITEYSKMECNVSLISSSVDYNYAVVGIEVVNLENPSKSIWYCYGIASGINNNSYNTVRCKNPAFDNFFTPENQGIYRFKVNYLKGCVSSDCMGRGTEYTGGTEEVFSTDMHVIDKNQAFSLFISYASFALAGTAILISMSGTFVQIRRFFKDD